MTRECHVRFCEGLGVKIPRPTHPYILTDEGWLFLAVVIDLFSRQVVGWSMRADMTRDIVIDALRMALFQRKRPRGVIMHTDRGSQYCSHEHRALLDKHGLIASMSAKGNGYDNAAMESWNHSLKVEAIHGERFASREQARAHVFEYIEVDYNRNRLHSTLGYFSPEQFELANASLAGCPKFRGKINYRLAAAQLRKGRRCITGLPRLFVVSPASDARPTRRSDRSLNERKFLSAKE